MSLFGKKFNETDFDSSRNFAEESIESNEDDFFTPSYEGLLIAANIVIWALFLFYWLGWL